MKISTSRILQHFLDQQPQERNRIMYSLAQKDFSQTLLWIFTLSWMMCLHVGLPVGAEAMLVAGNVLKERELGPMTDLMEKKSDILRDSVIRWEKRLFDLPLVKQTSPNYSLQWKHGPNVFLKDPGVFPGIELGVEMHSFRALQSIIPEERLPKGIPGNSDGPLLLPPSVIAPDYNGGFLRFTW